MWTKILNEIQKQKTNKWPGLALETNKIWEEYKIEDSDLTQLDIQTCKKNAISVAE